MTREERDDLRRYRARMRRLVGKREPPPPASEPPRRKLLCVLSTPCSGTTYLAHTLAEHGLGVGHERVGRDGLVCGLSLWGLGVDLSRYTFAATWRLIRHPRLVLETLPALTFRRRSDPDLRPRPPWYDAPDPVSGALRWWVHTHERLPHDLPTVRLEHVDQDIDRLLGALSVVRVLGPLPRAYRRSKSAEHREPRRSWAELHALDPEYADRARRLVERFDLPEPEVTP